MVRLALFLFTLTTGALFAPVAFSDDIFTDLFDGSILAPNGTDKVTVTTNGSRKELDVSASISNNADLFDYIYLDNRLLNGGSKDMDVNGSSTAVNFDTAPGSGVEWEVESLTLLLVDPGTMDPGDFGSISNGLSNGLVIKVRSKGTEYTITTLTDNVDIGLTFTHGGPETGSSTSGFLNEADIFIGLMKFDKRIILRGDDSDYIRVTVQDNLSGIDNLSMNAHIRIKI